MALGIVVILAAVAMVAISLVFAFTSAGNGYVGKYSPAGGDKPLLAYARFCNAIRKNLLGLADAYTPGPAANSSFLIGVGCCVIGVVWLIMALIKKKFIHVLYFFASIAVGFVTSFGYFLGERSSAYHWDYLNLDCTWADGAIAAKAPLALVIFLLADALFVLYVVFFVLNLISLIKIKKQPKAAKEEEPAEEAKPEEKPAEEPAKEEPKEEPKAEEPVKEEPKEEPKAEEKPAEPVVAEQPVEEKKEEEKPQEEAKPEEPKAEEKPAEEKKEEAKPEEKPAEEKKPAAKKAPAKKAEKKPAEKKEPAKKAEPKKEEEPKAEEKKPVEKKEKAPAKKPAEKKPAEKKEPAKKEEAPKAEPKAEEKPAAKGSEKPTPRKDAPKAYHISQHPQGGWQVKGTGSDKALKRFPTQAEAIKYARELEKTSGVSFRVHSMKGKIRKA